MNNKFRCVYLLIAINLQQILYATLRGRYAYNHLTNICERVKYDH